MYFIQCSPAVFDEWGFAGVLSSQNKLTAPGVNRRVRGKTLHRLYAIFTHLYIQGTWRKRQKQNNSVWNEGKVEATLLTYSLRARYGCKCAHTLYLTLILIGMLKTTTGQERTNKQRRSYLFFNLFLFLFFWYMPPSYLIPLLVCGKRGTWCYTEIILESPRVFTKWKLAREECSRTYGTSVNTEELLPFPGLAVPKIRASETGQKLLTLVRCTFFFISLCQNSSQRKEICAWEGEMELAWR